MMLNDIVQVVAILRAAHRAAALTGAGISTPSGISDFRGDSRLRLVPPLIIERAHVDEAMQKLSKALRCA